MRPRDIQAWLRGAHDVDADPPYDSDDDMQPHTQTSRSDVGTCGTFDWDDFTARAAQVLHSTKRKPRATLLETYLPQISCDATTMSAQRLEVYQMLYKAYLFHTERSTRLALLRNGALLLDADTALVDAPWKSTLLQAASKHLQSEAERVYNAKSHVGAPRSAMAAVHAWLCMLLTALVRSDVPGLGEAPVWAPLVRTFAHSYDALCSTQPAGRRDKLLPGELHRAWRMLRAGHTHLSLFLQTLLAVPDTYAWRAISTLGLVLGVCYRMPPDRSAAIVSAHKNAILQYYTTHVLSAKTSVSAHVLQALVPFFRADVTQHAIELHVFPTLDKMLLRSPDIACAGAATLFSAARIDATAVLSRVQTPALAALGSANAATRSGALRLLETLLRTATIQDAYMDAVLKACKACETRNDEQRSAIYALLQRIPPGAWSTRLLEALGALVQKETQPAPLHAACTAAWRHTTASLSPSLLNALAAKMQAPKIALHAAVMQSLAALHTAPPALHDALAPLCEASVEKGGAASFTAPESALEACGAAAFLALAAPKDGACPALRPLLEPSDKMPFLLQARVLQKMHDAQLDASVHVLALERTLAWRQWSVLHDAALQSAVVELVYTAILHRISVHALLRAMATHDRRLCLRIVTRVVYTMFQRASPASFSRVLRELLFLPLAHEQAPLDDAAAGELLSELVVYAHLAHLDDAEHETFVQLCRAARCDPYRMVAQHRAALLDTVHAAQNDPLLCDAAEHAISTLAFIAPDAILAPVAERALRDAELDRLAAFSAEHLAIWAAPHDVPFVNVVHAPRSDAGAQTGNMEKWDAEVRASLAQKKAPSLSKEQQLAIARQLDTERHLRAEIDSVRARIATALRTTQRLAWSGAPIGPYMAALAASVRAALRHASVRALGLGSLAAATLTALASCCEERVALLAHFVVHATLHDADPALCSPDYALGSVEAVELRVLYELRLLVDASPLTLPSAAFFLPWIAAMVERARLTGDEARDDAVVERVQLALDIFGAHSAHAAHADFPCAAVVHALLAAARTCSMLAHDAVQVLRAYGAAIARAHRNATSLVQLLLHAALSEERRVRDGALQCLLPMDLTEIAFSPALFIAMHDADEELAKIAAQIWTENDMDVVPSYTAVLVPMLEHAHHYTRATTPRAIASACAVHPDTLDELRAALCALYSAKNYSLAPAYDQYGMVIDATLNREDPWPARLAVAQTFVALAPQCAPADLVPFLQFALPSGAALSDREDAVRGAMLSAATRMVELHGAPVLAALFATLESALQEQGDDRVAEASVILLGCAAQHCDAQDAQVQRIVDRLLAALRTPSEMVQEAAGSCLVPLMRNELVARAMPCMVDQLLGALLHGDTYAARRGAAYGLAGVVLGGGIGQLRALRIFGRLRDAVQDTKSRTGRQGVMFAYEVFARTLRVLFEPYAKDLLQDMLLCFGDTHADVREATSDAARALMQSMSGQCLKLTLPELLAGLEEKQWRTKKGAIELLGAMAWCAPRQLSAALPTVIPRLSEVLTDSHTQVRNAGNKSLKQFGEVIHNPEIHQLVPTLLKALVDPNAKTSVALQALLDTKFVHYIDGPSLALIAPIIERGLRERSVAAQKHAAQIVGNLASLTAPRDFVPYLARYTPLVRHVLVSPVPDARSVAARALGTLVERLGEAHFAALIPSLMQVLQTNATGVDRHGAAQGLAEVLAGLGLERMEHLLPSIIANTQARAAYVREGHLALLMYLPATFGARFVPHLVHIVPPIIASIADDDEAVRDASMRAGRMIIVHYQAKAVELLLPQLEPCLTEHSWRVRLSGLQLVSELLFRLSGISRHADTDADADADEERDAAVPNSAHKALAAALGVERRTRLLAAIYILRQDPNIPVRQAAAHTWKALVQNTPRTARETLPVMLDLLLTLLAAAGSEQREMASRTLGELVRKLGEKILQETIPILAQRAIHAPEAATRAGVCAALTDILSNATKAQLEDHQQAIMAIVRCALVDAAPAVRQAAAQAFDKVQRHLGSHAVDATLPTLLDALHDEQRASTALAALREMVRTRADAIFPLLVPALAQVPMRAAQATALAALVPVAHAALAPHISAILSSAARTLLDARVPALDLAPPMAPLGEAIDAVFSSIASVDALHQAMVQLLGWMGSREGAPRRAQACQLFVRFCRAAPRDLDWSEYAVDYVRRLVSLMDEDEEEALYAAWTALQALLDAHPKDACTPLVVPLRRALASVGAAGTPLRGLQLPRGAQPFVAPFLYGLLHGNVEQREAAAAGLAELVEKSGAEEIKPFITSMVGPLIRLCGDRHAPPVKVAILDALDTMVRRVPRLVRAFYPQLQRSFQKALGDPSSNTVRMHAGAALGRLMAHQTRIEPVVLELVHAMQASLHGVHSNADGVDVGDAMAMALVHVLEHAPPEKRADARAHTLDVLRAAFYAPTEPRDAMKKAMAALMAAMLRFDSASVVDTMRETMLSPVPTDVQLAAWSVGACMDVAPEALYAIADPVALARQVAAWLNDAPSVARPAREARDLLKRTPPWSDDERVQHAL
ncbi:translational activator of GCN4 [Malassezia vespertilionis]|uniref:Gcn1p n=1 Tax=Malassezia vespertilionis TaxID=2020962 RepID=A0A2N1JHC5_9BASI|nr:translational activator of GCN4 [Malassezia vespertilionis]PKI85938.1 Gcn1p [Malassezia vespertilionis]WFD04847.1 translational activator of GCN4 [Malassezia vespertilionis]